MNKKLIWACAVVAIICGIITSICCNSSSTTKEQLLEIYDVKGSEAKARLIIDGKEVFTTDVYIGKNGIDKMGEGDAKTPTGTLHVLKAFGIKPNPGTTIPYVNLTSSIFACDEKGPYYNQVIDTAQVHHANCKGEDMSHIAPEYNYGVITDFNEACIYPYGSNIFIHCKGRKTQTAGCIAFDEDKMMDILRICNESLVINVRE